MTPSRRYPCFPLHLFATACLVLLSVCRVSAGWAQATLENPAPNSAQSGLGVISGWACQAERIEIEFNNDARTRSQAGYGTARGDTAGACGDTNNGFGLLFNWNILGDGTHRVRALADGQEFAQVTVTVTTLGQEYAQGLSREVTVTDFPGAGERRTLVWQEAQQNFVITTGQPSRSGGTSGRPPHVLENPRPGSYQSGLGLLSGWVCEANRVELEFNDDAATRQPASYGTARGDTVGACGDSDNGFGLLFNWNILGDGVHTVRALADGVEFARSTVTVTTLGQEFAQELSREVTVTDFPEVGDTTTLAWQQAKQNFVIVAVQPSFDLPDTQPTPIALDSADVATLALTTEELEIINFVDGEPGRKPATAPTAVLEEEYATLVTAEGSGGTVFITLKLPQSDTGVVEGPVDMSVEQTVLALTLLLIGTPDDLVKADLVPVIQNDPEFAETVAALRRLQRQDPYVLERLANFPDMVGSLTAIATRAFETYLAQLIADQVPQEQVAQAVSTAQAGHGPATRGFISSLKTLSASPFAQAVSTARVVDVPATPVTIAWANALSPWRYDPGRKWAWYIHPDDWKPINPLSIAQAPFLARSLDEPGVAASGNPSMIVYALEFYDVEGALLDTEFIGRNSGLIDKTLASGAARGLDAGALPNGTRYVRMVKWGGDLASEEYARALNGWHVWSTIGTVVSLASSTASTLFELSVNSERSLTLLNCAIGYVSPGTVREFDWDVFISTLLPSVGDFLGDCLVDIIVDRVVDKAKEKVAAFIVKLTGEVFAKFSNPVGWGVVILNAVDTAVPFATSLTAGQEEAIYEVVLDGDGRIQFVTSQQTIPDPPPDDDDDVPPPTPTNLRATADASSVTLEWDAVAGTGMRYVVYQHYGGGRHWAQEVAGLSTTFSGLEADTEYCWDVVAVNAARQESAPSARQCARTGTGTVEIDSAAATCGQEAPWRACYHQESATAGQPVTFALTMPQERSGVWHGAWCVKTTRQGLCAGQHDHRGQINKRSAAQTPLTFEATPPRGVRTFWVVAEVRECNRRQCTWPSDFTEVEFHHIEVTVQGSTIVTNGERSLFWLAGAGGLVQRSNLDGSGVETLVDFGRSVVHDMALDLVGRKAYIVDANSGTVHRANLDGTSVETIISGLSSPEGIALDGSGKMYVTARGIFRANLDGSGVETIVPSLPRPQDIALDVANSMIYWVDHSSDKIRRAHMDGSGVEDLVTSGLALPEGLTLDLQGGKMYWADAETRKIQRANLDGSGVEDVLTGLRRPYSVAFDSINRKIYWTDDRAGRIQRANLDGSSVETVVDGAGRGGRGPFGLHILGRSETTGETFSDTLSSGGQGPEMVVIPTGSFRMGCLNDDGDCGSHGFAQEKPVHQVSIRSFALSKYEVTFDQWEECVSAGGCTHQPSDQGWGRGSRPVINVNWQDAQEYVAWLSRETGRTYRLPTEAEWEYAARAGTETKYSWGNEIPPNLANCRDDCGDSFDEHTAPVGSFPANPWGLHDMHGNVWEWMEDCLHTDYNGAPTDGSAWTSGACRRTAHDGVSLARIARGGAYDRPAYGIRSAIRGSQGENDRQYLQNDGIRVARSLP